MNSRKVIVADDHDIFNIGLRIGIEKNPEFKVIKEAKTGEEVLAFLADNESDLLVCDYMLPGINGIKVLSRAKRIRPEIKTILISSLEKLELQTLCEKNRIDAYIFKSEARSKIVEIAQLIFLDQKFRPIEAKVNNPFDLLTFRELETLRLWEKGKSMEATGSHMKINSKTVETHRSNIKKKFPGLTKEEIFSLLREHGIV